jgi:hypothetical protein
MTGASMASATTLVALTGDKTLVRINLEQASVIGQVDVNGGGILSGIDVRPADGQLYGLFRSGKVVTIVPSTGAATLKSQLNTALPRESLNVDFNPVANLLRIVSRGGANLRANVDTGLVTVDTTLTLANPQIRGVAYTNSFAGALSTLLYDIGSAPRTLFIQFPPNDGVLVPVGQLGTELNSLGFDIAIGSDGRNRGWLIAKNRLMEIDLAGGKIISQRPITGLNATVRDMAILSN